MAYVKSNTGVQPDGYAYEVKGFDASEKRAYTDREQEDFLAGLEDTLHETREEVLARLQSAISYSGSNKDKPFKAVREPVEVKAFSPAPYAGDVVVKDANS